MAFKKKKYIFFITAAIIVLLFPGIKNYNKYRYHLEEKTCFMMDTYVTIYAIGPKKITTPAIDRAFDRMQEIDKKFSHLNPESPLYAFNQQGIPITDEEILKITRLALKVAHDTEGAFDVTIMPLAELWGFYGDGKPHVPGDDEIRKCLSGTGYQKLKINDTSLVKTDPKIKIDLGGIAKGYGIGEAAKVLKAEGVKSALIDGGGDVYAMGKRGSKLWTVGIKNPHGDGILGYLEVEDLAVMGSGDYERYFEENGKRYHHIFNPETGFPARGLSGITLVHPDPMIADAWNTALFVLGPEKAMRKVEDMPSMESIMVSSSGEISFSSGLRDTLNLISNND